MFERLSGDYNCGYTKALMDMKDILKGANINLHIYGKKWTPKLLDELMDCCIENRAHLRETEDQGFIRWNCKENKFEYFEGYFEGE